MVNLLNNKKPRINSTHMESFSTYETTPVLHTRVQEPYDNQTDIAGMDIDDWKYLASLNKNEIEKTIDRHNGVPTENVMNVHANDINDMIEQTHMVYTLGTVTGLTLLIAGIFIARE